MYESPQFDITPHYEEASSDAGPGDLPYTSPDLNETRRQLEACFSRLDEILIEVGWTSEDIVTTIQAIEHGVTDDMKGIVGHLKLQATLVELRPLERELWQLWLSGERLEVIEKYYDDPDRHSHVKLQMQLANLIAKLCRQEQ